MDPDRRDIDLRGAQGTQVGDGGVQVNFFTGVTRTGLSPAAYLEQVRRIAPPELLDRGGELTELAEFCLGTNGSSYARWCAGPWAGKSALLSTFVLRPPPGVQIVSFFITARLAAQDTREAFTEVLAGQLATLLGQPLQTALPEAIRDAYVLDLLSRAAVACQEAGRRLVLVVDGLDEDRGVTVGPDAHSIAGLLPADPPAGMRVIVASRADPPVPDDVPDWHPLRKAAIVRLLPPSRHAQGVQRLARQELQRLLSGSKAGQDLLGLLVAARGGLSASDLSDLAEVPLWKVEEILHTVAGRTLQARPSLLDANSRPGVYLLGHEELQAAAADYLGDRLDAYRNRLHAWADSWRTRRWPSRTPEYLLAGYFRLLEELEDLPRMTGLADDMVRHDRMLDLTGGDAAALAEVRSALDRIAAQDNPDLGGALALAYHRDHLTDRNAHIPAKLPAVWASLGQLLRAEALARSITDPSRRANAIAEVAGALAQVGLHEQAGAAAAQAEAVARSITDVPYSQEDTLVEVAGALARAGLYQQAEGIARSITDLPDSQESALVEVAGALARAGQYQQAEVLARLVMDLGLQVKALAGVAAALARAGLRQRAEAIAVRAEATARSITDQDSREEALSEVAEALAHAGLYRQAEALARSITVPYFHEDAFAKVAGGLARAGLYQEAEAIADSITVLGHQASALAEVAEALADAGRRQQAEDAAVRAEAAARLITDPSSQAKTLAEVARALARGGLHERAEDAAVRAEAAARLITDPSSQARTLAKFAEVLAGAGMRQQAEDAAARAAATACTITQRAPQAKTLAEVAAVLARAGLYQQAEAIARSITDQAFQEEAFAEVAGALARAGLYQQAEAIANSITDPHSQATIVAERAAMLARTGMHQQAEAAATQAEAIARSITLPDFQEIAAAPDARERTLAEIARVLAQGGLYQQAEAIARSITDPDSQGMILAEVAVALARGGLHEQAEAAAARAEAAARTLSGDLFQEYVLEEVAGVLARGGLYQQAEAIARSITSPGFQENALAEVAGALAHAGLHQQGEALARSITDPYYKANALAQTAIALARAGRTSWASRMAAATCAVGQWTTAAGPVLLLMPSAYTALLRALDE